MFPTLGLARRCQMSIPDRLWEDHSPAGWWRGAREECKEGDGDARLAVGKGWGGGEEEAGDGVSQGTARHLAWTAHSSMRLS